MGSLRDSRREVEVDVRARITAAQARLERVSRLINAAYEDKLEGRIDDAFFNAKRAEWESQRAGATEEIQRLARATAKNLDTAIQVFEIANRENEEGGDSASQNRRHSVWSAQLDERRTFAADPEGWGSERMLAFEAAFVGQRTSCAPMS